MDRNTTFTNATNSSNATEFAPMPQFSVRWYLVDIVYVVVSCILAFVIVLGNSLVIGAFRVNRRLRTTSNMLLMSLATADMMIGQFLCRCRFMTPYHTSITWGTFIRSWTSSLEVSSVLNLTVISLERCYALIYPIKHRNIRNGMPLYIFNQFLSYVDVNTLIHFLRDFKHNFFKNFAFFLACGSFASHPSVFSTISYPKNYHDVIDICHGKGIKLSRPILEISVPITRKHSLDEHFLFIFIFVNTHKRDGALERRHSAR